MKNIVTKRNVCHMSLGFISQLVPVIKSGIKFFSILFLFANCAMAQTKIIARPNQNKGSTTIEGTATNRNAKFLFTEWEDLLKGAHTFDDLYAFIKANPNWPRLDALRIKAEKSLVFQDSSLDPNDEDSKKRLQRIANFFSEYAPLTGVGQFIYARTLLSLQLVFEAKIEFHKLVTSFSIPKEVFPYMVSYKKYLPLKWLNMQANHLLLIANHKAIDNLYPYLSSNEQERIRVRQQLLTYDKSAVSKAYKFLNESNHQQGIRLSLIRYYLHFDTPDSNEKAFDLIQNISFSDERMHPEPYWKVRHKLARALINQRRYQDAYKVVKFHGYEVNDKTVGKDYRCSEDCVNAITTTAWLGIEYGNEPLRALGVLKDLEGYVSSHISKARIIFWTAKAHIAMSQLPLAYKVLIKASQFRSTFYGQVALSYLQSVEFQNFDKLLAHSTPPVQHNLFPTADISKKERRAFAALDLVRVIKTVPKVLQDEYADHFFSALLQLNSSLVFQQLVFDLAKEKKDLAFAVRLSKKKHMTFRFVYPLLKASTQKQTIKKLMGKINQDILQPDPSFLPALVHAIIRRESVFDERALSSANAKGMMQLITPTANTESGQLSKNFGISISRPINLFDRNTNILLGMSHLITLIKEFDYNLVMAIAAYNAGPAPIKKWTQNFGHPNRADIDIINWIESIPYWETRNYVQRVLESFMVYQQILAEQERVHFTPDVMAQISKPLNK